MQSSKTNGFYKLVSFIVIAVLLLCLVGFAANGWQSPPNDEPESGENGDTSDKTDENKDGEDTPSGDEIISDKPADLEEDPVIVYHNTLTGLSVSKEIYSAIPYAFVMNPSAPLYGVSSSELTIEFPLETGNTRIVAYTSDTSSLWKIGALAPTRNFISDMSNLFGGILISHGSDDIVKYNSNYTENKVLDLSAYENSYYRENTLYVYTTKELTENLLASTSGLEGSEYKTPPYDFVSEDSAAIGNTSAKSVIIPYSLGNETQLYYSEQSGKYIYFKGGSRKVDLLSGDNISYTNIFVLFADATTYEKSDGTELVVDTSSGGYGYYVSGGYKTEIRWSINPSGNLEFKTLSGERLTVNRGNAYIGYFKASNANSVILQ